MQEVHAAGREASADEGVIDFGVMDLAAEAMGAIVIAEGGEGRRGGGEALEDVLIRGVITEVRIVNIVTGEADEVGLGGDGEVSDVVEVVQGNGAAEVKVREVDEAHGPGEAGHGDGGVGDFDAPLFNEAGISSDGSGAGGSGEEKAAAGHLL